MNLAVNDTPYGLIGLTEQLRDSKIVGRKSGICLDSLGIRVHGLVQPVFHDINRTQFQIQLSKIGIFGKTFLILFDRLFPLPHIIQAIAMQAINETTRVLVRLRFLA